MLKLYCLRVEIEDDNVFVHSVPTSCVYFSPKLLAQSHDEWEWSIQVVNKRWRQVGKHGTSPTERKEKHQHCLKYNGIHPNVIIHDDNLPLMDYTNEYFNEKLWLYFHEQIIEIKVF